jgi:hypothetical protein
MKQDEALKMAIEALKNGKKIHSSAILAIEEALAQQSKSLWHGITLAAHQSSAQQTKPTRKWNPHGPRCTTSASGWA